MKQLLLYTAIYNFTAEEFIEKLNEIPTDEDIVVRLNSPGGSVFAGWGIIAAISEREGKTILKIDGNASSMAAVMIPFFDEVHALDVTQIMIHRAIGYVENDDDRKMLDDANKSLRKKLEARIDMDAFEKITGSKFSEVFDAEKRKDFWLSAKDAKKIKLVDKVVRLDPKEIEAMKHGIAAYSDVFNKGVENETQGSEQEKEQPIINNNQTKKIMNLESLKAENSELFAEIKALGVKEEQSRVTAWLAFKDIDAEKVMQEIEAGTKFDPIADSAYFTAKGIKNANLEATKAEAVETVETPKEEIKAEENEAEKLQAEVFAKLNLKAEEV